MGERRVLAWRCHADRRSLMAWKGVIIVTFGRTGSTLLMGLLNRIDGYLIRGENKNCFYGLFGFWQSLKLTQAVNGNRILSPSDPFFNDLQLPAVAEQLSHLARTVICGHESPSVFGFKEIWYASEFYPESSPENRNELALPDYEAFESYLDFLCMIFPQCCLLLNTRDIESAVRSDWWANDPVRARRFMEMAGDWYMRYMDRHTNCFQISYEDVLRKSGRLREMYAFLEAAYDDAVVDRVLSIPHGYKSQPLVENSAR
ncbi:MAG: hypothetical protein KF861_21175 [Planctomycetaceae bacterium]|nr:hypothetical protein [Planctomycetaceae bacterium]